MKYSKHWKLEVFITAVSFILIPLIYLLFSPFFGQILFAVDENVYLLCCFLSILLHTRDEPYGPAAAHGARQTSSVSMAGDSMATSPSCTGSEVLAAP